MTEHTAFQRLAAMAIDFELEPTESVALTQHLRRCDSCMRLSVSLRSDAASLQALPRRTPSPHIAAAIARAARGEARSGRSPMLLLGLGFLLVAGLAGAVIGGAAIREAPRSDDSSAFPSPIRSDAAIVVPSPDVRTAEPLSPEPSPNLDPRLGVEWQVASPEYDGSSGTSASAVTANGAGFVAVGRTCQPDPAGGESQCWGGVQLSSDGLSWELVPRQPGLEIGTYVTTSGPAPDMIGVAARANGIVAIGYAVDGAMTVDDGGVFGPAVWRSADGRTWGRAPVDGIFDGARFSDIVATESGFVIVGAVYGPEPGRGQPRGAIWTSADGRAWQRVPDGSVFDIGGYRDTGEDPGSGGPRKVIAAAGMILAVGQDCNDQGRGCVTAFWSSPDGISWARQTMDEPDVHVSDVAATTDGFLAVGIESPPGGCGLGEPPCAPVVLESADGHSWARTEAGIPAEALPAPTGWALDNMAVVGDRIIASDVEGRLWWSSDGRAWDPLGGVPDEFYPATWQPIAASPVHAVIVGDIHGRIMASPPQ